MSGIVADLWSKIIGGPTGASPDREGSVTEQIRYLSDTVRSLSNRSGSSLTSTFTPSTGSGWETILSEEKTLVDSSKSFKIFASMWGNRVNVSSIPVRITKDGVTIYEQHLGPSGSGLDQVDEAGGIPDLITIYDDSPGSGAVVYALQLQQHATIATSIFAGTGLSVEEF